MKPNPQNACSGLYDNWLEVNLLPECNARCSWCVERRGYHPPGKASIEEMIQAIEDSGAENVIFLGGEPTLHSRLADLIFGTIFIGAKAWITTNGSRINEDYVLANLNGLTGANISIHHYESYANQEITELDLNWGTLRAGIMALHARSAKVRLNCNCIAGYIDNLKEIRNYIHFAKSMEADSVRFAELKEEDDNFVNLTGIMNDVFEMSNDPYVDGCSLNTVIDDMPVNFRLMCGLQTPHRPAPINPEQKPHKVLYYDGKFYNGWQRVMAKEELTTEQLIDLLTSVKEGKIDILDAAIKIRDSKSKTVEVPSGDGAGCRY